MILAEWIAFFVLIVILGAQLKLRSFAVKHIRRVFYFSVVLTLGIVLYWSYFQYQLWRDNLLSKFFLPPHQSINYFLGYVGARFFGPWLIAVGAAMLSLAAAYYLNKRFGGRFFEDEEPFLFALGVLLVGYPGFLFYIPLLFVFYLLFQLSVNLRLLLQKRKDGKIPRQSASSPRVSAYWLWLGTAILAILIKIFWIPKELLAWFNL